jgi:hypothetical protein
MFREEVQQALLSGNYKIYQNSMLYAGNLDLIVAQKVPGTGNGGEHEPLLRCLESVWPLPKVQSCYYRP